MMRVDEVARAHLLGAARQRHVHGRRLHGRLKFGGIECRLAGGQCLPPLPSRAAFTALPTLARCFFGTWPMAAQVARSAYRTCPATATRTASSAAGVGRFARLRTSVARAAPPTSSRDTAISLQPFFNFRSAPKESIPGTLKRAASSSWQESKDERRLSRYHPG